jgi:curli production assembly/transport component CsgF
VVSAEKGTHHGLIGGWSVKGRRLVGCVACPRLAFSPFIQPDATRRFMAGRRGEMPMGRLVVAAGSALALAFGAGAASAQQLVYTPRDPSFGGNPLNATQLMALANAQNQNQRSTASTSLTEGQQFAQQLQSRLLSSLADSVTNTIFGTNAQSQGSFNFAGESVTYVRGLSNTTLTLTDSTGAQTVITVPNNVTVQ